MPLISLIASISGIFSIPLAIYFYFKPRQVKKKILYGFRSIGLLPSPPSFADLQITYKGQKIESLYMTRVALWNAGDEIIEWKDDIYPEDQLRIVFENPNLNIESQILYVSGREERIRPSFYPENEGSLSEGILIEFDFLDPTQGLVLQIMHQDPNQEFAVQGKMKNSHRNKIGDLRNEDLKRNAVASTIGMFSVPLILLFGIFFVAILGSISMFLLGHLFSFLGFISAEDFALIMSGSDSKVPQEDTLIAVSIMISIFLTGFLVSKTSDFFSRKTRDILKASLNVESELLEVFQDSNWSLSGRDILR